MDIVTIGGLRVRGCHGVYESERMQGQEFVVDAVLELDLASASSSDQLADTVDYGELARDLAAVVAGPPVNLIETLAEQLARTCLRREQVRAVTVTVHKPQAPLPLPVADIAVTIRRVAGDE